MYGPVRINLLEDQNKVYDNTVGSRSKCDIAYLAGFLDGDGSLMLQIKKRSDTSRGFRFMATICLYQDTRHEQPLYWMREVLGIGYVSRRNDGMSELRINGFARVRDILKTVAPYVRFKHKQVAAMIEACDMLASVKYSLLSDMQIRKLVDLTLSVQNENYSAHRKRKRDGLLKQLGFDPVTTETSTTC